MGPAENTKIPNHERNRRGDRCDQTGSHRIHAEFKRYKVQLKALHANLQESVECDQIIVSAKIKGPSGCPYEGGFFKIDLSLPSNYPYLPPEVRFLPNLFHLNVGLDGILSEDLLRALWTPDTTIVDLVNNIITPLLVKPNFDNIENVDASDLFLRDQMKYLENVRDCVQKSKGE